MEKSRAHAVELKSKKQSPFAIKRIRMGEAKSRHKEEINVRYKETF